MTACTGRGLAMPNDIIAALKALKLHGMAASYAELADRKPADVEAAKGLLRLLPGLKPPTGRSAPTATSLMQPVSPCIGTWPVSSSTSPRSMHP
jgi:hypothetical protein